MRILKTHRGDVQVRVKVKKVEKERPVKNSGFQPGKLSWFHLSSVMNTEKKFREYISDNNNKKTYNLKQSKWNTIKLKLNENKTFNLIKLKIEGK